MLKWSKVVILILLAPLAFALLYELLVCLDRTRGNSWPVLFFVGAGPVFLVMLLLPRGSHNNRLFVWAFVHELAHLLVALATFSKVHEFVATDDGSGHIKRGRGPFLITLAPYYLPTFAIPFIVARFFVRGGTARYIDLLIGATYAFHLGHFVASYLISERVRPDLAEDDKQMEPDTKKVGSLFSFLFCAAVNALIALFVLNVVWGASAKVIGYHFVNAGFRALEYYKVSLAYLGQLIQRFFVV